MSKFAQAFLSGIFFTFILDFFLFLGVKLHYIDFHEIDLYYNILFADNQNIYLFALLSALLGYMVVYLNNNKVSVSVLGLLFFGVLLTLIAPIGKSVGTFMFMKKNVTLHENKYTFTGDIYYNGRYKITFYDYELKKIILLNKKDLK